MKILIIEDDEYKANQIKKFLFEDLNFFKDDIIVCMSFQSGMKEILGNNIDVLLLDMSIPTFDVYNNIINTRHRAYGGKDVLNEMKRRNIVIKTIVITQHNIFFEGSNSKSLKELDEILHNNFTELYLGMVHYDSATIEWKSKLRCFLTSGGLC